VDCARTLEGVHCTRNYPQAIARGRYANDPGVHNLRPNMSRELQHGQGDDKPQGSDPYIACNYARVHRTQERPVEVESHPR
jgi:hypothetical protein